MISKELISYIEENFGEEIVGVLDVCIHSFDDNLTCYDNFKDLIPYIMSIGYELGKKDK